MSRQTKFLPLLSSLIISVSQVNFVSAQKILIAGKDSAQDSAGTAASFDDPQGVAVDAAGNIYVADTENNKIRKITPSGIVSTLAGSGSYGSTDGQGTAASFGNPRGVALDLAGNIYVADTNSNKIRKITPSGYVSTIAGSGSSGSTDGQGSSASFNVPWSVAVDSSGNIFVADRTSHKIRKITPSGYVSTVAGSGLSGMSDGRGTAASFSYPSGITVDSSGNIYVADNGNNEIRKITSDGQVTTLAGSAASGSYDEQGVLASFSSPLGVSVDSAGNIYVADNGNHKIRKVTPGGQVTTLAGIGSSGSSDGQTDSIASFHRPSGVAVDSLGNVFIADSRNNKIRKLTPSGQVTTLAGSGRSTDGQGTVATFSHPRGLSVDSTGNIYVADSSNNKIRKITPSGYVSTIAGSGSSGSTDGPGAAASFYNPYGVAVDSAGNVYVVDYGNDQVRKITSGGQVSLLAGSGSRGAADGLGPAASFTAPVGVAVDSSGNVFVADLWNYKIRKISPAGRVSTFAGSGSPTSIDGQGTAASFMFPTDVVADSLGNVFVADQSKIRKITADGYVSTLVPSELLRDFPTAITLDQKGHILATSSHTLYNITSDGRISSSLRGMLSDAKGIAVDAAGNIIVSEKSTIIKIWICPEGMQYSQTSNQCAACPPSTFKRLAGGAACQACPANSKCWTTDFTCNSGFLQSDDGLSCFQNSRSNSSFNLIIIIAVVASVVVLMIIVGVWTYFPRNQQSKKLQSTEQLRPSSIEPISLNSLTSGNTRHTTSRV